MRYELFCGHILILKSAMGCHGNHAFSQSPYNFCVRATWFRIQGVPMNNLASMENCPEGGGVAGLPKLDAGVI